jgi:hypothetical protein
MYFRSLAAAVVGVAVALPAGADDVTDTLDAVRDAYDAGDIALALEELTFLQAMLTDMRTDSLAGFLPDPPDGWSRDVETETGGIMAMTGGGAGATATYSKESEAFTISLLADSPMIAAMGAMLSNPMIARAAGGKLTRVGSIKVLEMDGNLSALIDGRILLQADGAATEVMLPVVEQIDFDGLAEFRL